MNKAKQLHQIIVEGKFGLDGVDPKHKLDPFSRSKWLLVQAEVVAAGAFVQIQNRWQTTWVCIDGKQVAPERSQIEFLPICNAPWYATLWYSNNARTEMDMASAHFILDKASHKDMSATVHVPSVERYWEDDECPRPTVHSITMRVTDEALANAIARYEWIAAHEPRLPDAIIRIIMLCAAT